MATVASHPMFTPTFTPVQSSVGGLVLALAVAGKMVLVGRVTGISGTVKGLVTGSLERWRFAFTSGLVLGGGAIAALRPEWVLTAAAAPLWRAVAGGLLVGFGTALSNGCTSGHGLCGISRLSLRSVAATCTFMAAGVATATATQSMRALGFVTDRTPSVALSHPSAAFLADCQAVGLVALASYAAIGACAAALRALAPPCKDNNKAGARTSSAMAFLEQTAEVVSGATFAAGLGLSGMTSSAKVAGFLDAPVAAPTWDPSLMFVMGVALVPLTVLMAVVKARERASGTPALTCKFELPKNNAIDAKLLIGSALFGCGWGLYGACPGPAIVQATAAPSQNTLAFLIAMAAGQLAYKKASS